MQAAGGAPVTGDGAAPRRWAGALAVGVIALDQATKAAVVATLPEGRSRPILDDVLRLSHIRNTGAAFGTFRGLGGILALAAVLGVAVFAVAVVRDPSTPAAFAAALVAAGAAGNLIDRLLRHGGVVDFVDFRFWPAFNVADSAITVGAVLFVVAGSRRRHHPHGDDASEGD